MKLVRSPTSTRTNTIPAISATIIIIIIITTTIMIMVMVSGGVLLVLNGGELTPAMPEVVLEVPFVHLPCAHEEDPHTIRFAFLAIPWWCC